jgi:hypothetical protein
VKSEVGTSSILRLPSSSRIPPSSVPHLPPSIPHPHSSIFTPHSSIFNPPSSGPDVNPPSSDLTLQSRSPFAIASAAPNPATGSGFAPDTQETGKRPDLFLRSAIQNGTAGNW